MTHNTLYDTAKIGIYYLELLTKIMKYMGNLPFWRSVLKNISPRLQKQPESEGWRTLLRPRENNFQ